ncbi:armadillo-type protein [Mycena capillaripes]|nr:armadillo-type protein [Mycena capillaripes]
MNRPQTPQSTHSWWSDSNPVGPNLSIHSAAKPLMRFMYHDQELDIRAEASERDARVVVSLGTEWNLVATLLRSSDAQIRHDAAIEVQQSALHVVAQISESLDGVQAIAAKRIWEYFPKSLDSLASQLRLSACTILKNLAVYEVAAAAGAEGLSEMDIKIRRGAIYALAQVSCWPEGAQAVAEVTTPKYLANFLHWSDAKTLKWTCEFLRNLLSHAPLVPYLSSVAIQLVTKIAVYDNDLGARRNAVYALSQLSSWPDCAKAAAEAGVLESVADLLDSRDIETRIWTCEILGKMALHRVMSVGQLGAGLCMQIISLLRDDDKQVRDTATVALSNLSLHGVSSWRDTAKIVDARALQRVPELLDSSDTETQKWTCEIVGIIAVNNSESVITMGVQLCSRIVSLSRCEDKGVRERALYVLAMISHSHDGAAVVRGTEIWNCFSELLDSADPQTLRFTCQILGNLALHESTFLNFLIYVRVISLLRDIDPDVQRYAAYALSKLSHWPEAAELVTEAKTLEYLPKLLDSYDTKTCKWTCEIIGNMTVHNSTLAVPFSVGLCVKFVSLLSRDDRGVRESALHVLSTVSRSSSGAEMVAGTTIWLYFPRLLVSIYPQTRRFTCQILSNLTTHAAPAFQSLWGLELYGRIVSLLRDEDIEVRRYAIYVLSKSSSRWPKVAQIVVWANALEYVPNILHSSGDRTRKLACELVENVLLHESTSVRWLDAEACGRFVDLLSDEDEHIRHAAIRVLSKLSQSYGGAHTISDTGILEYVPQLLDFDGSRPLTCEILRNLAFHKTLPNMDEVLRTWIEPLLSHEDSGIRENAMGTLQTLEAIHII